MFRLDQQHLLPVERASARRERERKNRIKSIKFLAELRLWDTRSETWESAKVRSDRCRRHC